MDIVYKVTDQNQLIIKQARPWASYWSDLETGTSAPISGSHQVNYYPNPTGDDLTIECECDISVLKIADLSGRVLKVYDVESTEYTWQISFPSLSNGVYSIVGVNNNGQIVFANKVIKL